jgi:hypothetical protein
MNQVPDRRKLRQEYVKQKAGAYFKGTLGAALLLPATLFCIAAGTATLMLVVLLVLHATPLIGISAVSAGVLTLLSGVLIRWCWQARHEFLRATELPFVPPVTPNTLPAEEVLVRGSEEPTVQSGLLLRAAQGVETPKEELLRIAEE